LSSCVDIKRVNCKNIPHGGIEKNFLFNFGCWRLQARFAQDFSIERLCGKAGKLSAKAEGRFSPVNASAPATEKKQPQILRLRLRMTAMMT
jgi:hypothetical protein